MTTVPAILAATLLAAAPAFAATSESPLAAPSAQAAPKPFDLAADPDYANYRETVVAYLATRRARGDAHVCVLGKSDATGARTADVWWREGGRLIRWDGRDSPLATAIVDLEPSTSGHDPHGAADHPARTWATDFETTCTRWGKSFVVREDELELVRARR